MTSVPPEGIISGVDYGVRAVNGRPPQRDGDFDGQISLDPPPRLLTRPDGA